MNYKVSSILILVLILINCSKDSNPFIPPEDIHYTRSVTMGIPYLIFDADENPIIIFGRDTISIGRPNSPVDGEFDILQFVKYNSDGEKIIDDKQIVQTKAILDIAVLYEKEHDQLNVFWLDTRNNPDFSSGRLNTYQAQIFHKTIDSQGETVKEDSQLTHGLAEYKSARNDSILTGFYNGTMLDIKTETVFCDSLRDWIIIDSNMNEHHFNIIGKHWDKETQLTYIKRKNNGKTMIEQKTIIKNEILPDAQWAPVFQNMYFTIDSSNMIHSVWQLNDGKNNFYYYYLKLDNNGNILVYDKVGVKYDITF